MGSRNNGAYWYLMALSLSTGSGTIENQFCEQLVEPPPPPPYGFGGLVQQTEPTSETIIPADCVCSNLVHAEITCSLELTCRGCTHWVESHAT